MNDTELLAELDADPEGVGYAAMGWSADPPNTTQYQAVADLINNPAAWGKDRTDVPGYEIFAAIAPAHFLAVSDPDLGNKSHQAYLSIMFGLVSVPLNNSGVRSALITIFTGMSSTLSAISALQTLPMSRAAELRLGRVRFNDLKRVKGNL